MGSKIFIGIGIIAIILIASNTGALGGGDPASPQAASSQSLPPAQRTAIHAPAISTQSAANAVVTQSAASAAAQEADAARVYAQAVADQRNKNIAVATQQAAMATQVANDTRVSAEYATMMAVSYVATKEAISRTIALEAENRQATVVSIHATSAAVQDETQRVVLAAQQAQENESRDKFINAVWWLVPPCVVIAVIFFLIAFGLSLLIRFWPHSPTPQGDDGDDGETPETPDTGNTGNTGENTAITAQNTGFSVFPINHDGTTTYAPRMTPEERRDIYAAKDKALRVLQAAVMWNQAHRDDKDYDPARVARFDKLGVKAEDRGDVCEMLEALRPAAVTIKQGGNDQGTYVTPDYGASVVNLLRLIQSNDVRLYPKGIRPAAVVEAETLNAGVEAMKSSARIA